MRGAKPQTSKPASHPAVKEVPLTPHVCLAEYKSIWVYTVQPLIESHSSFV